MGFPAHESGFRPSSWHGLSSPWLVDHFRASSSQQNPHGLESPCHFNPMIEPQGKRQVVGLAQQRKRTDLEQRRFAERNPD